MLFHAFVCIPMVDLHASCACDFRSTSHFLFNLLSVFTKTKFNRTEKVLNTSNLLNPFPTYFHVHIMKKNTIKFLVKLTTCHLKLLWIIENILINKPSPEYKVKLGVTRYFYRIKYYWCTQYTQYRYHN